MSDHKSESFKGDAELGANDSGDISTEAAAHHGVKAVEIVHTVWGKYSKWFLFLGLALSAYIYSLDSSTTSNYLIFATSTFDRHSLISSIQVAQAIIVACGKPVIAKIADVGSRGTAYAAVLVFYVIGYIVIASAKNVETIAGGSIIYSVGYTGLQLLTQIIIADVTTLQWRGLVSALISAPFIINAFVGAKIAAKVLKNIGWRWGYGMFAILVPVSLAPLIITLLWGERKARKIAAANSPQDWAPKRPLLQKVIKTADKLDVVGLLLIAASVALILLPLTLSTTAKDGWNNPSIIAMIVVGGVLIPVYALWEYKFANFPVIVSRFVRNRSVVIACAVGAFDFVSFYISYTYLYSFVFIVKPWSLQNILYFMSTQTVTLTVFGIAAGAAMRFLHRAKPLLITGLVIRILGCGLMIHSRGANASDAEIVWSQLLQGIGGGFAAVASQVSAQASVPHVDVASVTAVVLLITEIGGGIGSAIAGAIWANTMPGKLAQYLPFLDEETRGLLFGSIYAAGTYPRGHPIREGVILAYDDVMKTLTIVATVIAVIPLLLAFLMPNWYLGEQQNAADNLDLSGKEAHNPDVQS